MTTQQLEKADILELDNVESSTPVRHHGAVPAQGIEMTEDELKIVRCSMEPSRASLQD